MISQFGGINRTRATKPINPASTSAKKCIG
jgi:hypothetical protein